MGTPDTLSEAMVCLDRSMLHVSTVDPALAATAFLNEVADRYPDAISFAAGAVHRRFLAEVDVAECVDRYVDHTAARQDRDQAAVRRELFQYGPSQGIIGELLAEALHRDERIDVPAEAVLVTVGCQEALLVTLRTLCAEPNDIVAVVDPCYVGVVGAAKLLGLGVVPVADQAPGVAVDQLHAVCATARDQGQRVRVLYVAPDFANPLGGQLDLSARQALLAVAAEEDLLLIEDTTYRFTATAPAPPTLKELDGTGRVVHIGTFAKLAVPGVRIGYVIAGQPVYDRSGAVRTLAQELATVKGMVTLNTPPFTQAMMAGMLLAHGGSLTELGRPRAEFYRANLAALLTSLDQHLGDPALPGVFWDRPAGGFFVRVRLPFPVDDQLLERSACDYRVLWTPMRYFHIGVDGGLCDLRLSCSQVDLSEIDEGIARLARLIRAEYARMVGSFMAGNGAGAERSSEQRSEAARCA